MGRISVKSNAILNCWIGRISVRNSAPKFANHLINTNLASVSANSARMLFVQQPPRDSKSHRHSKGPKVNTEPMSGHRTSGQIRSGRTVPFHVMRALNYFRSDVPLTPIMFANSEHHVAMPVALLATDTKCSTVAARQMPSILEVTPGVCSSKLSPLQPLSSTSYRWSLFCFNRDACQNPLDRSIE